MNEFDIRNRPLEAVIELDGGYAMCPSCGCEVFMHENCNKCGQLIDWSWLAKSK